MIPPRVNPTKQGAAGKFSIIDIIKLDKNDPTRATTLVVSKLKEESENFVDENKRQKRKH